MRFPIHIVLKLSAEIWTLSDQAFVPWTKEEKQAFSRDADCSDRKPCAICEAYHTSMFLYQQIDIVTGILTSGIICCFLIGRTFQGQICERKN